MIESLLKELDNFKISAKTKEEFYENAILQKESDIHEIHSKYEKEIQIKNEHLEEKLNLYNFNSKEIENELIYWKKR